ncbi:MAG: hypothetical protein GTO45_03585 [Candidatus Aminicenantes bacterium]|nr:hypothetical protein [Candidatus Aminicenantes bacterium]NIM77808.1 hypothetical protein [Candidatus Aminicenantes bacterium]NIN17121.1 hypothetical protein [Candidatus Aminicenantes bacterium]NIN41014.1 hypothetical protein [Candidatus Aminicenantes bacterium]NIN83819.1 hypothetical protein [Candidatus Aminicenantes bacterium]
MKSFKAIFKLEFKRFRCNRNVFIFSVLILISISIIQISGSNYQNFLKAKDTFQETERQRVMEYLNYTYYGWYGISVLFIPSNLSILYTNTIIELFGNVNTGERLTISMPIKGKTSIPDISGYMNLSCIILLFWTFVSLFYGYDTTKNKDYKKFLSQITRKAFLFMVISRIILLNMAVLVTLIIPTFTVLINNINPFKVHLLTFALLLCLISLFFFSIGLNFGNIKNKAIGLANLGLVYFVLTLFLPWVGNEIKSNTFDINSLFKFELENLNIVMDLEERALKKIGKFKSGEIAPEKVMKIVWKALNTEFQELRERENQMKMQVLKRIKSFQIISSFFPINSYLEVNKEISGYGDLGIIDFHSYLQSIKDQFLYFYVKKKFLSKSKPREVEDFVKNNENLFFSKGRLTHSFGLGVGFTILYIIGLLFNASRLYHKRMKRKIKGIDIDVDFKDKSTVFVLCKNETIKEEIFNHYKNQDAVCLEKINPDDFRMNGIKPADLLEHLSRVAGVDEKRARENLEIMGVDIDTAENSHETILKIYAAVMVAADQQLIVINELFKKESRQFETDVFRLLSHLEKAGKRIIYLSTEMYQPANGFDEQIRIDKYGIFPIDFDGLTLR